MAMMFSIIIIWNSYLLSVPRVYEFPIFQKSVAGLNVSFASGSLLEREVLRLRRNVTISRAIVAPRLLC